MNANYNEYQKLLRQIQMCGPLSLHLDGLVLRVLVSTIIYLRKHLHLE